MQALALDDIEKMIHLVATSTDPTVEIPLHERKRILLEGTAELIGADMWIWSMPMLNPQIDRDVMSTGVVDGGWRDDAERVAVYRVLTDPKFNDGVMGPVIEVIRRARFTTFLRSDLITDENWERVGKPWQEVGFQSHILSIYPLDDGVYSGIGFHRRIDKPEFCDRERAIVHLIFQQIDWLHRQGSNMSAGRNAVQLTPRQRQVLLFLLGGDSRKAIARKLSLSEHTVGDYLKQIYKQFSVNTRSKLLAHFIAGGQQS
jgi:DNA-binding CsgD family transcriptional regulator